MRGRKPKPTAIKELEGNPGKRPLNRNEPRPRATNFHMPAHVRANAEAKAEWERVVPELRRLKLLTCVDRAQISGYCMAWAHLVEAEDTLAREGLTFVTPKGYVQQRPEVSIARQCRQDLLRYSAEFGLTPSARSRMEMPEQPRVDEFSQFLNGARSDGEVTGG